MTLSFQFGLTSGNKYHIKVSIIDPRNPMINGFLSNVAISEIVLSYQLAGSSTLYYA